MSYTNTWVQGFDLFISLSSVLIVINGIKYLEKLSLDVRLDWFPCNSGPTVERNIGRPGTNMLFVN